MKILAIRANSGEIIWESTYTLSDFKICCGPVNRGVAVSQNAGVRALLVHALHERARQFYEHYGFQPSPTHPMTLMLRLSALTL